MLPETIAQIALVGLRILEQVIKDQPAEARQEAWKRWFAFWDQVEKLGKP